jgi:hypothetical protein
MEMLDGLRKMARTPMLDMKLEWKLFTIPSTAAVVGASLLLQ